MTLMDDLAKASASAAELWNAYELATEQLGAAQDKVTGLTLELGAANSKITDLTALLKACQEAHEPPPPPPPPLPVGSVLDSLGGVHVLHQFPQAAGASKSTALTELGRNTQAIQSALEVPGVVAFCARVPWNIITDDFDVLNEAREVAGDSELTIRFMAGRHTPEFARGSTLTAGSASFPAPFTRDGLLNNAFLGHYEDLVVDLAAWARENEVKLIHLSHYAKDWAEFYAGPEVQALPNWRDNLVKATLALVDIGLRYSGPDLSFELPMSGHGPLMRSGTTPGVAEQVARGIQERTGALSPRFFIQGNGWDETRIFGAPNLSTEVAFDGVLETHCLTGVQMIQPQNTYDWARVFDKASEVQASYAEVYLPSFSGGTSAQLKAQAALWQPYKPS